LTSPLLSKLLAYQFCSLGFKPNLALIGDGAQFRKLRKAYGNFLSARSSLAYRDAQLKYAGKMAEEIKESPEKWHSYLSRCSFKRSNFVVKVTDDFPRFATRVIFSIAFAIDVSDEDDPYFKLADKMGWIISNMGNNGITILDIAPWGMYNFAANFGGKQINEIGYCSPAFAILDCEIHPFC
jgi:hypothetical protein